jgi:hypothetical protein
MIAILDLTNNKQKGQLYTLIVTREKKKKKTQIIHYRRQFNYYLSTRVKPCRRGHDCVSSETADDHIWPLKSVTRVFVMVHVLFIRLERKKKLKKYLMKKQKLPLQFIIKNFLIFRDFPCLVIFL